MRWYVAGSRRLNHSGELATHPPPVARLRQVLNCPEDDGGSDDSLEEEGTRVMVHYLGDDAFQRLTLPPRPLRVRDGWASAAAVGLEMGADDEARPAPPFPPLSLHTTSCSPPLARPPLRRRWSRSRWTCTSRRRTSS